MAFASLLPILALACEKVPLLAPTGSTITLTASTTVISADGSATILAQLLEGPGTPPHSGTRVTFTTTLGRLEPASVNTDANGQATVNFIPNGANGTAVIAAASGGATTGTEGALHIAVGSAAVGRVILNANPSAVPATGGATTVTALVVDVNGNPLASTPVAFTTTAGSLSAGLATTDGRGAASVVLTTNQAATVTASVGAQASSGTGGDSSNTAGTASATVNITVSAAPTVLITPPSTSPSKGLPATFTFVVTPAAQNGSAIRSVSVNWGDGAVESLGSISGSQSATHVFVHDGTFSISATVTDAAGGTNTASTSVVVIPVPRPTIIIQFSPVPAHVNTQTTVSIQITVPAGIGITETVVDFGDGTKATLGGAASASPQHVYTNTGTYTVTVTVTDTSGQTTVGTNSVSVGS
jgi:hypothetical protein